MAIHLGSSSDVSLAQTPAPPDMPETIDLALGAELFAVHCTECHGLTGAGDGELVEVRRVPYPGNFLDPAQTDGKTPQDYFSIIANGNLDGVMPNWDGTFDNDQLWAVAMYTYTLHENQPITNAEATPETTPPIRQSAQGTISGLITIGTQGVTIPAGTVTTLHVFNPVTELETTFTTPIDADNRYSFSDVTITAGDFYFVSVNFAGRNYGSSPVTGDPLFPNMDLPVIVYDTTNDANNITIQNMVVQIQPSQGLLQFTQVVQIRNTSDRLYVGNTPVVEGINATVVLPLPVGAAVVGLEQNEQFVVDQTTFTITDTRPILPNEDHLIIVTYLMPYEQDAVIEFPVEHRFVGQLRLLIGTDELTVAGDGLTSLGKQTLSEGGAEFSVYGVALNLMPDDLIRYELSGRVAGVGDQFGLAPVSDARGVSSDNLPLLAILIAVGVLVIVIGGVILINRNKPEADLPIDEQTE
jgi:mono/diheme cytochrome c family protein